MMKKYLMLLLVAIALGNLEQTVPIADRTGRPIEGYIRATIIAWSTETDGRIVWTGTTDGSLPAMKLVNGYIHNINAIIPGYVKDSGELWLEILMDGRLVTARRLKYIAGSEGLHRDVAPSEGSETTDVMDLSLNIGEDGGVAHVLSDMGIGTTTPEAKLDVEGDMRLAGGVAVDKILDEDDMVSDDEAALATQQSIKAYVDEHGGADEALFSVSSDANRLGRFGHMMFVPSEGTEITESDPAHNDTIYIAMGSCGTGPCSAPPEAPTSIMGPTVVCEMADGVSYSVPPVEGATYYYWDLPTEAYIASGSGSNSVIIDFGATDGDIVVHSYNACGVSTSGVSITISMNHPPVMPGSITGPSTVCEGATQTFSTPVVSGATAYTWTLPSGAFISSGYGSNSISVTFGTTSGTVCVTADNACGSSDPQCVPVTVFSSLAGIVPGAITGPSSICSGETDISYSISEITDATTYAWTVPSDATIVSGIGTNSILVDFGTASGSVSVTASNTCGSSDPRTLGVSVSPSSVGGTISGVSAICLGSETGTMTLSGNVGSVTKWQKSHDGGGWVDISRTEITYSETPSLAGAWEYRAEVRSGACDAVYSASHTINVAPTTVGGTVTGGTTPLCFGSSTGTLTLSGHTGSIVRWQRQLDGGSWTDISHTLATYSETPSSDGTWQYRAVVQSSPCTQENSAPVTIVVSPATVASSVTGGTSPICLGSSTGTMTLSGYTGDIVKWQRSTDGGSTWADISHITSTYIETPSSAGTYTYRAAVQSSPCSQLYSTASSPIVVNSIPSSDFTFTPVSPLIGATVDFSASESGASYSWSFASGTPTTSTAQNSSVSWSSAGTYTISLTVTKGGCSSMTDTTITVRDLTEVTFNPTSTGRSGTIQTWTVPAGVTSIIIEAWGSQGSDTERGGTGGLGARMKGTFTVTPGATLQILVGQRETDPPPYGGGGGGGSFVAVGGSPASSTLLIAAGGGGGGQGTANGRPGVTTTSGTQGLLSGGAAGSSGGGGAGSIGFGGAGYSGDGGFGRSCGTGQLIAQAFVDGGVGGQIGDGYTPPYASDGGFGGGGCGVFCWCGAGGGGGYSGGGGGGPDNSCDSNGGGGGGSYNIGSDQDNSGGVRSSQGLVVIRY